MGLPPNFPSDPHVILDPSIRWIPGDYDTQNYMHLLPPLVQKIREKIKEWRASGYHGASHTTKALLVHWFNQEHLIFSEDGGSHKFQYYFAQREAVESAIWLYEIEKAHDPISLIKFDSSGQISPGMFNEDWTRYVMKLATGAGKTKIMSLLIAWSFFHKLYESDSDLSTNFLLTAPNIIVLDRLRLDFDDRKIFYRDPVLPDNGYNGRNWQDDFCVNVHIQDDINGVSGGGNIFLTNMHRVYLNECVSSIDDDNTLNYFVGNKPVGKTIESRADLGKIIREVNDLVIINDEAHHFHHPELAGFKSIQDISSNLRIKGGKLSAQFDLTATPRHENGAIFIQTISDYPLVEAIRQGVVKTPVLPDPASRAKLHEKKSATYCEQYEDYLKLGYYEWKKVYDELIKYGRKSILFVMTDNTKNCDEVAEFLANRFPELHDSILTIHTNKSGEILESDSSRASKEELEKLRKYSREIDSSDSPYKAIVSVMMLREGWDVQSVVSIVGLRAYSSKAKILPEQTLGRGLRKMFRGDNLNIREKVSVIGTEAFMEFVEKIKVEGVDLEYAPMGDKLPKSPLVIEVDHQNPSKDIEELDIVLPILSPRIYREYKKLDDIDISTFKFNPCIYRNFSEQEKREIVFKDIDQEQISHVTVLDSDNEPNYQNVISYFTNIIFRDLRLSGGKDILFSKLKVFIKEYLFGQAIELEDLNTLRNLSEPECCKVITESFKKAINKLTVQDSGVTEVINHIKISKTRPFIVTNQEHIVPKKSIFNKIIADSYLELEFAIFLDGCSDIVSFVKNSQNTFFKIEYQNSDGYISRYIPDFIVKQNTQKIWIIETKGREDLDDSQKWNRLKQWCSDATKADTGISYGCLFIREDQWKAHQARNFYELLRMYSDQI